jgi:hypothetical protein
VESFIFLNNWKAVDVESSNDEATLSVRESMK